MASNLFETFDAEAFDEKAFPTVDYVGPPNTFDGGVFDWGSFDAPQVLLFNQPASEVTTDLLFTRGTAMSVPDATISATFDAGMPMLAASVAMGYEIAAPVAIDAGMPMLSSEVIYSTQTSRPLVGESDVAFQQAAPSEVGTVARMQQANHLPNHLQAEFQQAVPLSTRAEAGWEDGARVRNSAGVKFQDGIAQETGTVTRMQDGQKVRNGGKMTFQEGIAVGRMEGIAFQQGIGVRNRAAVRFQPGHGYSVGFDENEGYGKSIEQGAASRYQRGRRPPPGVSRVVPPVVDPCYPPNTDLLFATPYAFEQGAFSNLAFDPNAFFYKFSAGETDLLFVCERHGGTDPEEPEPPAQVIVPVRKVYVVLNQVSLRRVAGNIPLPTFTMNLSLDVDSWTWSFNASLPGRAYADVAPNSAGDPVVVEATINGVAYRFMVEQIGRERQFAQDGLRVAGRGIAAQLDAPYAPMMNFGGNDDRTAQQLIGDVLTENGVSMGWDVDWQLEDWLVPGGVWKRNGTYMQAINEIAAAAGGYVQPVPTAEGMRILPRYPVLPWAWDTVEPDFELPSALTTRESTDWVEKPRYDRVYVSGTRGGRTGNVVREGTAGEVVAPPVTDSLITATVAARQRGGTILADTGRIATIGLRLPVLAETGIIPPGKFVRYLEDDGTPRIGITRSVNVDVAMPEVWQQISVETHP